ncbi:MAG: DUF1905 domain-containing protein [Christensenellaceae bacterium]
MIYKFCAGIDTEGGRAFIEIPLNMWEETGRKGNIPCRVSVQGLSFECKLIPKGNGKYWIPITKKTLSALETEAEYEIGMEPIETLSRINHDSPYSEQRPIRKIDGIEPIPIPSGFCGHCCVAMLAGVPLSDVIALMGKGGSSWSKILEALDYYGISHASKAVYPKGGSCQLPPCCIVHNDNGFILWYKGSFCGVTDVDPKKTISYMEIFVV